MKVTSHKRTPRLLQIWTSQDSLWWHYEGDGCGRLSPASGSHWKGGHGDSTFLLNVFTSDLRSSFSSFLSSLFVFLLDPPPLIIRFNWTISRFSLYNPNSSHFPFSQHPTQKAPRISRLERTHKAEKSSRVFKQIYFNNLLTVFYQSN